MISTGQQIHNLRMTRDRWAREVVKRNTILADAKRDKNFVELKMRDGVRRDLALIRTRNTMRIAQQHYDTARLEFAWAQRELDHAERRQFAVRAVRAYAQQGAPA
jgi:hypothetical protein